MSVSLIFSHSKFIPGETTLTMLSMEMVKDRITVLFI